ncbi:hypothetical protein CVD28_00045 [Bacillus sp. M6-12]|uniref:hypothetical protein n=1 Tax=Bacillus sp. M6-12 TaxID=2054166 RepID=UPI000C77A2B7|nr:hypothetical protein [Bacillus sp. M6-12]PLS18827.1 hypothetical protein CVD28_00045 [Bacillus sp. M6-12]
MKKKYWILSILFIFTATVLVGCVEEYKTKTVTATVLEKEYDAPKTTYKTVKENGKNVKKKKTKPEEYEVTLQYKDIVTEFEDKDLYNKVNEGGKVKVLYKEGYDKNGKLVTSYIELID